MTRAACLLYASDARAKINQAVRELPRPGPGQTPQEARARWFLEQAARNVQLAEASWLPETKDADDG